MLGKVLCFFHLHDEYPYADVKGEKDGFTRGAIHKCRHCGKLRYLSFEGDGIGKWRNSLPEIKIKDCIFYKGGG